MDCLGLQLQRRKDLNQLLVRYFIQPLIKQAFLTRMSLQVIPFLFSFELGRLGS